MITISSTREAEGEPRVALTRETTKKYKGLGACILLEAGADILGSRGGEGIGWKHHKTMLDHYTRWKNTFTSLPNTKVGLY